MAKAIWNGATVAESNVFEVVEGNVYFPASAVKREYFQDSATHTTCPWKGVASYYNVVVNGQTNQDAAVLPLTEGRCEANRGPRRILEGRRGRAITAA